VAREVRGSAGAVCAVAIVSGIFFCVFFLAPNVGIHIDYVTENGQNLLSNSDPIEMNKHNILQTCWNPNDRNLGQTGKPNDKVLRILTNVPTFLQGSGLPIPLFVAQVRPK